VRRVGASAAILKRSAAIIQNILLLMLGLPTQIAASQPHVALTTSDIVLGALSLLTLVVEVRVLSRRFTHR
jgi:steroid 5-alpha reductase family enzyme